MATVSGVRSEQRDPARAGAEWRPRVPGLVAWVVRIAAVIAVLDILNPVEHRQHYTSRALDGVADGTTFAAAMFSAGALLVLAGALKRRKKRAWVLAVGAVLVGLITHLHFMRLSVVVVNLAVLALLLWSRRDFSARSERTGRLAAVRVLLVMGAVSIAAGMLLTGRLAPTSSIGDRFTEVLAGLIGFTPELAFRREYTSTLAEIALNTLGGLTALLTLLTFLAPARKPARLSAAAEQQLRDLLAKFGSRD
ncbi:MAG TPA: hypothetical protein VHN80_18455, partial [Kineosporiaceae bacterium]|nr:hypothetical protein [Kineosporiaceae bacterium]